ncbi:group-specific protein [Bacillus toyonensis]|uniref:Group-specific protein n=2 Tax=Bacillaceae TaxID=186817 RepID=A0AB73RAJ5_9BACI|nr:group-specific protein [Bacillus toyonensis]PEG12564.1 group-specific protein [Bacillus toyonensis]PEI80740.1 group-specific protein [Bacillus toyonensis]PEK12993.1 group-specific protein [Bacillus toyonensis]PEK53329.1 group-specific protein [Bacillus toyonensis]
MVITNRRKGSYIMNEIDRIINCCQYDNELFRTYINCLIQLKKYSETFQQMKIQLRNDYLIRGICEREVDEVVRGSKEYETYFLPKALQWNFLRENPYLIEKICEDFFAFEALHLTDIEWETIVNCMGNK